MVFLVKIEMTDIIIVVFLIKKRIQWKIGLEICFSMPSTFQGKLFSHAPCSSHTRSFCQAFFLSLVAYPLFSLLLFGTRKPLAEFPFCGIYRKMENVASFTCDYRKSIPLLARFRSQKMVFSSVAFTPLVFLRDEALFHAPKMRASASVDNWSPSKYSHVHSLTPTPIHGPKISFRRWFPGWGR